MQETHRLGWVWDAVLEGHLNDKWGQFYPPPSFLPKLPIQTVLNWDTLLQLFSLMSVAALHSLLIGYQRGQPTHRQEPGVVTLDSHLGHRRPRLCVLEVAVNSNYRL